MATSSRSTKRTSPAHDEWGVYDPQQAGLAALYARLDTKNAKTAPAVTLPPAKTEIPDAPLVRPTLRDAK
jgi:hypothetical protein